MKRLLLAAAILLASAAHAVPAAPGDSADWRKVDPDNLVLIDTKYGQVAVELAPGFAPNHVAREKALIRAHFYDGLTFYRVIDGFVAQGGIGEDTAATKDRPKDPEIEKKWPKLKAEFEVKVPKGQHFAPLGSPDLYAKVLGHVDGFAVGRDPKAGSEWLIQCPGVFAFARDTDPDTATTEFYIVIGQAPRRLDRNLTAFGRVVGGMQYLQKLERGDPAVDSGVIADKSKQDVIQRMTLASDLPADQRPSYEVMRTDTKAFAAWKANRRNPAPEFYKLHPAHILDICLSPVPSRKVQ
jgi:peptidylprolyl isomerase